MCFTHAKFGVNRCSRSREEEGQTNKQTDRFSSYLYIRCLLQLGIITEQTYKVCRCELTLKLKWRFRESWDTLKWEGWAMFHLICRNDFFDSSRLATCFLTLGASSLLFYSISACLKQSLIKPLLVYHQDAYFH